MTLYVIALTLIILGVMGMPLFAIILAAAMTGFYFQGIDLSVIAIEIYRLADTPLLMALPLFTLAGYIMAESRTSQRLVNLTEAFLGWVPGGWGLCRFSPVQSLRPLPVLPALQSWHSVHCFTRRLKIRLTGKISAWDS